jgi:hypothetical protein
MSGRSIEITVKLHLTEDLTEEETNEMMDQMEYDFNHQWIAKSEII